MGRSSREKGARGERELKDYLRDYYGYDMARGRLFEGKPDVYGLPDVHIEVKRVERLNVLEAYKQSVRDAEKMRDGIPVVIHRKNNERWLVTLSLDDWMDMYSSWR